MTKVVCIRFNSGEEVIGRYQDNFLNTNLLDGKHWEPKGMITLSQVLGITVQPIGPKQLAIGLVPFAIGAGEDAELVFNLDSSAIAVYPASASLEKDYLAQTSKIALATPGLKI